MADPQSFRSAFNGFNREDVVRYIEYMNNRHSAQVAQLNSQVQALQAELAALRSAPARDTADLTKKLAEANARCAALAQALEDARAQQKAALEAAKGTSGGPGEELAAYRRAERTERMSQERAAQLCAKVNGILADATARVEETAAQMGAVADQAAAQIGQLQEAILDSKNVLQAASAALYGVVPASPEEP